MSSGDRGVKASYVDEKRSPEVGSGMDPGLVEWQPLEFKQQTYNNFHVEYALTDGNFIVHFFVHPDALSVWPEEDLERWWQNVFAQTMSTVAQEHFNATLPRIMAKYTMETASWWFRAQGYGHLLDPFAFLHAFFELLDGSLPSVDGRPPAHAVATASS
jgi:hypothetical protein